MKRTCSLVVMASLALPVVSHAIEEVGAMKCKNGTVEAGTGKATVVKRCGRPTSKNKTPDQPLSMGKTPFNATEEWGYTFGSQEFVVMIDNDVVVKLFKEQR